MIENTLVDMALYNILMYRQWTFSSAPKTPETMFNFFLSGSTLKCRAKM